MPTLEENVQIVDINKELTKLGAEGKKKGLIKGCLFNLIVYSQDSYRTIFLKEIVQTVKETFPSRIIFIECDSETHEKFLKVTVEEEIIHKDGSSISCDCINIKCTPNFLNRISFLILPHFVPDVPIYLLWGQDPSQENEIIPYLENFASRVIFDPDSSCDIRSFCQKMLTDISPKKISVTDLHWASLTSWREILFQVFDTPEKIEQLRNCKKILIRYNNKISALYQHTERRSLYLQSWLAARLNWQYIHSSVQENGMHIKYQNKQEFEVILVGENFPNLTPGAIIGVEIQASDDTLFDLSRQNFQPFIRVHISKMDTCDLPITLPLLHSKKGLAFMNEIFFGSCNEHYWHMLKALQPLQIPC